mgnify:FL=1
MGDGNQLLDNAFSPNRSPGVRINSDHKLKHQRRRDDDDDKPKKINDKDDDEMSQGSRSVAARSTKTDGGGERVRASSVVLSCWSLPNV